MITDIAHLGMLTPGVQSSLARGPEQWLWFLGVDARDPEDNLLVRNGFLKFIPKDTKGSSRYRRLWRGVRVELHSFCVGVYPKNANGFIFTRTHRNYFLYAAPHPPCPGRYQEDCFVTPETQKESRQFHAAASCFLDWLEDYERWVERVRGRNYRSACYDAYHMKWQPPAEGRDWFRHSRHSPGSLDARDRAQIW